MWYYGGRSSRESKAGWMAVAATMVGRQRVLIEPGGRSCPKACLWERL